jgi:hypothetical protein
MMNLLNRKVRIEKELCGSTQIFGKNYNVEIEYKKNETIELDLVRNTIIIYLPAKYKKIGNTQILKVALGKMYDEIARIEIESVMEETRIMLNGLAPENYEIRRIPNKLAKTLENKTIVINPEIVKYDKNVLRYVILHEFCHLKYKRHTREFWAMIEKYMPYYEDVECKAKVA